MPAIFYRVNGVWCGERLVASYGELRFSPIRIVPHELEHSLQGGETIALMRIGPGHAWAAIVPDGFPLRHNGQPVPAGLRVLAHGDLLSAGSEARVFFSTEEAARIETFAGDESPASRCKSAIAEGRPSFAARLAACCTTSARTARAGPMPTCTLCPHPTALDAGALSGLPKAL
jgi:hypothetical protein